MSADDAASRVDGGEASLGDAQSSNPPEDAEMILEDAPPLDADTDFQGERLEPEERDGEDPAPAAP